jgi:hypothetical protein
MAHDRSQPAFVLNRCPVCGKVTGVLTREVHGAVTHERCDSCLLEGGSRLTGQEAGPTPPLAAGGPA